MKDKETREYRWYLLGCEKLHLTALSEEEFRKLYRRYRRCNKAIGYFETRRASGPSTRKRPSFLEKMIQKITQERDSLEYLAQAVTAGRGLEEDEGSAGVPAYAGPREPVLVGAGAKLLPPLDPEPQWRDP